MLKYFFIIFFVMASFSFGYSAKATIVDPQVILNVLVKIGPPSDQLTRAINLFTVLRNNNINIYFPTFTRNLYVGVKDGVDIIILKRILNTDADTVITNNGSAYTGNLSAKYDLATKNAVIAFQNKYAAEILTPLGLKSGTGYVGPATLAKLNKMDYDISTVLSGGKILSTAKDSRGNTVTVGMAKDPTNNNRIIYAYIDPKTGNVAYKVVDVVTGEINYYYSDGTSSGSGSVFTNSSTSTSNIIPVSNIDFTNQYSINQYVSSLADQNKFLVSNSSGLFSGSNGIKPGSFQISVLPADPTNPGSNTYTLSIQNTGNSVLLNSAILSLGTSSTFSIISPPSITNNNNNTNSSTGTTSQSGSAIVESNINKEKPSETGGVTTGSAGAMEFTFAGKVKKILPCLGSHTTLVQLESGESGNSGKDLISESGITPPPGASIMGVATPEPISCPTCMSNGDFSCIIKSRKMIFWAFGK